MKPATSELSHKCVMRPTLTIVNSCGSGALVGMAGSPVQVRNPDDSGVQTQTAAFMSSPLPIAGFAIIEAANIDEAINLLAKSPCAVVHGVVEIWPLTTG